MLNYFRRHASSAPQHRRRLQQDAAAPTTGGSSIGNSNNNPDYIDLVNLVDFNVQVARVPDAPGTVQTLYYDVNDVVSAWMNEAFVARLSALGYQEQDDGGDDDTSKQQQQSYAQFDSVILMQPNANNDNGRELLMEEQEEAKTSRSKSLERRTSSSSRSSRQTLSTSLRRSSLGHGASHRQAQAAENDDDQDVNISQTQQTPAPSSMTTTTTSPLLLTAEFKGAAFFTKNATQAAVPDEIVQYIQQQTLRNQTGLLYLLQSSSVVGLGQAVVDVAAFTVAKATPASGGDTSNPNNSSSELTLIIYIAVGVAIVAFLFLLLAVLWAWRYDRRNREAYLASSDTNNNANHRRNKRRRRGDPSTSAESAPSTAQDSKTKTTTSPTMIAEPPITEIGGYGRRIPYNYPDDSVATSIDDVDVSTSLSQYYRSGAGQNGTSGNNTSNGGMVPVRRSSSLTHTQQQFNDTASVSSMESYGYSLDGYASTIAGGAPGGHGGDIGYSNSYGIDMDSLARNSDDDEDDDDDDEHMGPMDV